MYLSNHTPEDFFQRLIGKIDEYGEEARMTNRFQRNEKGELIPLTTAIKKPEIEFRNSSNIQIKKKSCGCMTNKVKEIPSS